MHSSWRKTETAPPPSYESCVVDNIPTVSGFDQFVRIVANHETLHFHAPNPMSFTTVPDIVQIRDSAENPILSIMTGCLAVSGGQNRVLSSREIMTPSGESLISICAGNKLISDDQILGILDDERLLCRQTLKAKNVLGDVIFSGAGDNSVECNCCALGCCMPNLTEITFDHDGVTFGQLKKSKNNSSGNELVLFNSAHIDPRTKALLIYAGYSAYLMFFVETKCGRIGDRGVGRRIYFIIIISTLLLMSIPLWVLT